MTAFHSFLQRRLAAGGFTTEDALVSVLPLMREVLEAHAAEQVAPLEGIAELQVDGNRIWFEEAKHQPPRRNLSTLRRVEVEDRSAVELVGETRVDTNLDDGSAQAHDLAIGSRDETITRPVYLPGYVAWEHGLEHHDPLTDVFSLGMILASLACGLDFSEPESLRNFVEHRRNLFAFNGSLHPVLAQAIVRMTELDRRRRAQDLEALLQYLENYREQEVELDFDLARIPDFTTRDDRSKQQVVLRKLRERLFEISRRNRLLHYRATMQTVNLTHASVPLSFDVKNVRPDQILVWNDTLHKHITSGKSLSLNKYLNFSEALYLPSVMDRIIADARRDQAEFGFAQLRLAPCFLHWANFKETPAEQYESPLVLLPVKLTKKKGIRDRYELETLSTEAEINPVVRHQFKELYDIDLPKSIDLEQTTLDEFFQFLAAKVAASEPAVLLNRIDRPRIELIHDKARRRLDQYRRRARLAGRGVRSFLDLDYSYDPANYHPLGVTLFAAKVRPPTTHLRALIEQMPRPRSFAVALDEDDRVVETKRSFFSVQSGGETNPYHWSYDLCSVTVANFKYRKMSLVRDYETLLDQQPENPAFEAIFSLQPRDAERSLPKPSPLEDRFDVVPCDPTQSSAIEEARGGKSYIIQGPPGTGKSQTITNLIADYVARGKRVLFVCEKRAAIDVVYARLRQHGLSSLCCLIHDSQTDKRDFIADLRQTYESYLAEGDAPSRRSPKRARLLTELSGELQPLEDFDAMMQSKPADVGVTVRHLLSRCIGLRERLPELSDLDKERLPSYAAWHQSHARLIDFEPELRSIQRDGVFKRHPLSLLTPRLAEDDRPRETILSALDTAEPLFTRIDETLGQCGVPSEQWLPMENAIALVNYARDVLPLARIGQMKLLAAKGKYASNFTWEVTRLCELQAAVEAARQKTSHWRTKLPADEVSIALEQAKAFETSMLAWFKPAWWRMRSVLRRSYDFAAHAVRPTWTQVLTTLLTEHDAIAVLDTRRHQLGQTYGFDDVDEQVARIDVLRKAAPTWPDWLQQVHRTLLTSDQAPQIAERMSAAHEPLHSLVNELNAIVDDVNEHRLDELRERTKLATASLDELDDYLRCVDLLSHVDQSVAASLRRFELPLIELEAATADHGLKRTLRSDRDVERFDSPTHSRHSQRLDDLYSRWQESNAAEVVDRVQRRFLEHVQLSNLSASKLTDEQKVWKKSYRRGRRGLEHEFGKSMRYKPIRELVSGETGEVVKDLKPVWLMSPLSVSDALPMDAEHFDVVIFDEASQVTLEEAVPAIFRGGQTIIVGDEMQLPPTNFFSAKRSEDEDDELLVEEAGELVEYDLDSDSLLNHAAKNLAATMLGWHYRSRSESLISYSNWAFYDGRLLTVPEERRASTEQTPLIAKSPEDAEPNADELLRRSVSFHFMHGGVYDDRRNRAEADYIAYLVRALLSREVIPSIGIVAFSEAQQGEIETALERLANEDGDFRRRLDAEREREVDGQFIGLLVKNLENIQGDERDVIILSICYGYAPNGKMRMNFGPINKSGGEKRLNVAFSRAKQHMAIVSSIRSADITNDYNEGSNCLKDYLRYAEAVSIGDTETSDRVLRGMSRWHEARELAQTSTKDPVIEQLVAALTERGWQIDRDIGQSHFRCDLAVYRAGDEQYRLGILIDTDSYYDQSDILERDMMRPKLLRTFGWRITLVLAKDWYQDRDRVLERLVEELKSEF